MRTSSTRTLSLAIAFVALTACSPGGDTPAQQGDPEVPDVVVTTPEGGAYAEGEIPDPGAPLSEQVEAPLEVAPAGTSYTLPVDLATVQSLDAIQEKLLGALDEGQRARLAANGVLAVASTSQHDRFSAAYQDISETFWENPPIFISSDSVLHLYHLFYDQLLKFAEVKEFTTIMEGLLPGMALASAKLQDQLDGDLAEAARRNKAFFSVGARLVVPSFPVDADVLDLVKAELALIEDAKALKPSPIFNQDCPAHCDPCVGASQLECKDYDCLCEDYSQYVPRGHYTQTEALQRYFRAMMYMGRIGLRMKSDMETRQAVLATHALKTLTVEYGGTQVAATSLWARIYRVTGFFVGASDDLTFFEYDKALREALGEDVQLEDLASDENLAKLRVVLDELRSPAILSGFVAALLDETQETKGWRFMGQRFAPDSYVLGQMVWDHVDPDLTGAAWADAVGACMTPPTDCVEIAPEVSDCICYAGLQQAPENAYGVCRLLPRGLDVMAALGSEAALTLLEDDERWCGYTDQLSAMVDEFAGYTPADWTQNAYWGWLHALRPLLATQGEGWPVWMQTFAWRTKQLNTALGSWAQLRHDTILYVKQSYTPAVAGMGPMVFAGYVEPVPAFYHRLAFLSRFTRTGLEAFDLLPEDAGAAMERTEKLLTDFTTIAKKELDGVALTEAEQFVISQYADTLGEIIGELAAAVDQGPPPAPDPTECGPDGDWCFLETELPGEAFKTSLVADVHTDGNTKQVLEVGTGMVDWVIVVHNTPEDVLVASVGPIFTYYEFPHPMSDRLTDEAWRDMLATGTAPARPEWIAEVY